MTADVCELLRTRAKKANGEYLFTSRANPELAIGPVRKAHDAAVKNAGIKDHFRLYDLRHTFTTRAVAAGVDLVTLSSILGHTKITMTMRYDHPAEEQKRLAIGKLETSRLDGVVQAIEKSHGIPAIVPTVN